MIAEAVPGAAHPGEDGTAGRNPLTNSSVSVRPLDQDVVWAEQAGRDVLEDENVAVAEAQGRVAAARVHRRGERAETVEAEGREVDEVVRAEARHPVAAVARLEHEHVPAAAEIDDIVLFARRDRVVASARTDAVRARAAEKLIVSTAPNQPIVAIAPCQYLVALASTQNIIEFCSTHRFNVFHPISVAEAIASGTLSQINDNASIPTIPNISVIAQQIESISTIN